MSYRVEVDARAAKAFYGFPKEAVGRIHAAVEGLATNPRPPGAKKLTGRDGYRIRAGDYRVLYEVVDAAKLVRVYTIGHRRDVYR